ncbi:MAG: MBL fold metallo-hydrolase [Candidatus Bathyarchaeota archaeon]|jgi:L-ascorbate metabolism protein UlaG (beta-lactamase superfamily)|nr:MBL fold metallo-hydrolase [Candidatus Bathyarchaeota archaeon]
MVVFIKWLAHASFQIKSEGKIIYIDLEEDSEASEKADLILVTHSHSDHCDPSKIKKVRKEDTAIIAPDDCVSKIGGDVKTLHVGEETTAKGIKVRAVDAYNLKRFRSPGIPFHPKSFGVGYLIRVEDKTIYHAGDTDFIPEMRQLGPVDVALLPSGDTYTMDNVDAADAAIAINPRIAIPMHRWSTKPEDFQERVEAESAIKVVLLREGGEYQVI